MARKQWMKETNSLVRSKYHGRASENFHKETLVRLKHKVTVIKVTENRKKNKNIKTIEIYTYAYRQPRLQKTTKIR